MLNRHKSNKEKKVGIIACLFFVLFLLLLEPPQVHATAPTVPAHLITAYQDILKLKLREGKRKLATVKPTSETLPLYLYVENLADILELLLTEDKQLYTLQKDKEKERLKRLQSIADTNPYKLFCIAEIRLQWAFVKLKFGEEFSAVWSLRQAYKTIRLNTEHHPDFIPNKKTYGLLSTLFGAVPDQYHWLLSILGLKGATAEGMEHLTTVAKSKTMFSFECEVMVSLINMYLMEKGEVALASFQNIAHNNQDNKLIQYLSALVLIKSNKAEEALQMLKNTAALPSSYLPLAMIDYLKGEVCLQKGLYEKSLESFASFLSQYKGNNFVKDAYYKSFLCHWLLGNDKQAKDYFLKASQHGTATAEADKYAAKQLTLGNYPERTILKIRLATDGGFYEKAEALTNSHTSKDFPSYQDEVEFIYRKARLLDKQGKGDDAAIYYLETLEKSGNNPWYFAPNAALHLGYLYKQKGNIATAKKYFEKAMRYENHEYKNSIDNKAKIALQEIQ